MSVNGKQKGARGEREWGKFCVDHGFDGVRRTAQYCGLTGDAADCVGLRGIHQEVKRVEALNIHKAMEQAIRDCEAAGDERILPIVAHRKNRTDWLITMRAEDWFKIYKSWLEDEVRYWR